MTFSGHYHGGYDAWEKAGAIAPDFRIFPVNAEDASSGCAVIVSAGLGERHDR